MKIFSADHEFNYSWDEVSTANWRKYCPWNKESDHVVAVDTLSRSVEPKTGILRTERLITCKQNAPRWVSTILGSSEFSYVYEVSYVTSPNAPAPAPQSKPVELPQPPQSAPPTPTPNLATTAAAQEQEKQTRSIWNRAIWTKPATSPKNSAEPSKASASSPASISQPPRLDAFTSHIPSEPAIQNRPSESAPPATDPPLDSLPSPPLHPGPRSPSITMLSTNLTFADLISVRETVTYTPSPSDPNIHTGRTRFEQNARITAFCGGWAKVRERIEGFTVERFGQNAERGRIGFEGVLETSRRVFGEEKEKERLLKEGAKV